MVEYQGLSLTAAKIKKKWDEAADNCSCALTFFHDCYKTQKW